MTHSGLSGTSDTVTATCPTGTSVLGGGYVISTTDSGDAGKVVATASRASGTGTWQVDAQVIPGLTALVGTWSVTASATCATA
jgi:hypothetical protein